ncbi:hypothetical protein [Halorubellus litoreus]|uniref:LEA14-like dessication related protein n=1 Tax=Halorubellus litoreus TaxID=755308 RepID=A0ABD5VMV6_9EURY
MIVRLWALAWAARYLKYVPILGWRFSEHIVKRLEARMDRDVHVDTVELDLTADASPTDLDLDIVVSNELPVDLEVTAVNLRIGYAADDRTVANVLWAADANGSAPANLETPLVASDSTARTHLERFLPGDVDAEAIHVDGSLTATAQLDVPGAKRLPLGELQCDVPHTRTELPT